MLISAKQRSQGNKLDETMLPKAALTAKLLNTGKQASLGIAL